jgi:hypothetical protein
LLVALVSKNAFFYDFSARTGFQKIVLSEYVIIFAAHKNKTTLYFVNGNKWWKKGRTWLSLSIYACPCACAPIHIPICVPLS